MKNIAKFLFSVFIFIGCSNGNEITETIKNDSITIALDTSSVDSIVALPELPLFDVDLLLKKFVTTKSFPFKTDSAYFANLANRECEELNGKEVVFLSQSMLETDFFIQSIITLQPLCT